MARVPQNHTERKSPGPWDGCWAATVADLVDAASGGTRMLTETQVRAAAGIPDYPYTAESGNVLDQLHAVQRLMPSLNVYYQPAMSKLAQVLRNGGGAALSGWGNNQPYAQRQWDAPFYDRIGANGHNVYVQGIGNERLAWLDPLALLGAAGVAYYTIEDALKFVWQSNGAAVALATDLGPLPTYRIDEVPFPILRHFGIAAGATIYAYDPSRPGSPVKSALFKSANGAHASGQVRVTWSGTTTPPVPTGGPFLRVADGLFAGLLIVRVKVTLDPVPTVYVVQPGDTLDKIAAAHGQTVEQLLAGNSDLLRPGQILRV